MLTEKQFSTWIEALRSGKYKQGVDKLRHANDSYCCLGVLLNTIDDSSWSLSSTEEYYLWSHHSDCSWGSSSYAPFQYIDKTVQHILTDMNDKGTPFDTIANYLEENKKEFILNE